jgi:hypothetical protein
MKLSSRRASGQIGRLALWNPTRRSRRQILAIGDSCAPHRGRGRRRHRQPVYRALARDCEHAGSTALNNNRRAAQAASLKKY